MGGKPSDDYIRLNPYGVAPGQVWASKDPRDRDRRIRVVRIEGMHAVVANAGHTRLSQGPYSSSKIRLDQFRRWRRTDRTEGTVDGRASQRVTIEPALDPS